jgi:hypothetical protein
MNPDLRNATRDATRALFSRGVPFYLLWWAVLILVMIVIALIARAQLATVDTSAWQLAGNSPKILLLVLAILLPTLYLPRWVSHGITRRAFGIAGGIASAAMAVAGGAIMAAGYAVEAAVYADAGWRQAQPVPPLLLSIDSDRWYLVVVVYTLLFGAYAITGWLIGAGYYRWGAWRGTLFLVPAVLPLVLTEALFVRDQPLVVGFGLDPLPVAVTVAATLAIAVLGSFAGYAVIRNMPLRHTAGWTV